MLATAFSGTLAQANPYASGITNNGSTVGFYLNENASDVYIVYGVSSASGVTNGLGVATNDLGALTKGHQTFPLTYNSSTYTSYAICVFNQGNQTFAITSTNSNRYVDAYYMRGVAVNNNPKTANFGRIYYASSTPGTFSLNGVTRATTRGIYALNSDQSPALGQADTAALAGMIFGGTSVFPNRLYVGVDDTLYVGDDDGVFQGGTPAYGVWALKPDLSSSTALFATNGAVYNGGTNYGGFDATPVVLGTLAGGNLTLISSEYDLGFNGTSGDDILSYPIGSGPLPYTQSVSNPVVVNTSWNEIGISGVHIDVVVSTNGYNGGLTYYCSQYRSGQTSSGNNSLNILDANGNRIWDSRDAWIAAGQTGDQFNYTYGVALSPDGQTLASVIVNGGVWVMPLTNGIPDLSRCVIHTGLTPQAATGWAVAMDSANNIYTTALTAGKNSVSVYSQGQYTLCISANDTTGSNGTFNISYPFPQITATAPVNTASQNHGTPIPGTFTLTRTGNPAAPLTVSFTLTGTATNSVYTATAGSSTFTSTNGAAKYITNTITFAAGQTTTNITITPAEDSIPRLTTTVILNVMTNSIYAIAPGASPVISIVNTGPQAIQIGAAVAASAYKGLTNDYASFTIQRLGDTNASSYVVSSFTYSGTATVGVDFTAPGRTFTNGIAGETALVLGGGVTINPGDSTVTATISPLQTVTNYVGNRSVSIGVAAASGYTVPNTNTATLTIIDNAYPPVAAGTVLFSDPLTSTVNSGTTNDGITSWNITYGNTNTTLSPFDPSYVQFGYSLANDAIGNAPSGASTALRVTANKTGPGESAGVNVYPLGKNFSGNYSLRFSMLMSEDTSGGYATEFPMFGVNHNGTQTNWFPGDYAGYGAAPTYIDGVWYAVDSESGGFTAGDYLSATGAGTNANYGYIPLAFNSAGSGVPGAQNIGGKFATTFAKAFKGAYAYPPGPYTGYPQAVGDPSGIPSSAALTGPATSWVDVEVKQLNNVITMLMNKTVIFTYTNTNLFTNGTGSFYICTNGTFMLGYDDPFSSVGTAIGTGSGAAYFSNVRVIQLGLTITSINVSGGQVVITFSSTDGDDTTSSFTVLSSGTAGTPAFVDTAVTGVTFSQIQSGPLAGQFQATFAEPATAATFYRIKHN